MKKKQGTKRDVRSSYTSQFFSFAIVPDGVRDEDLAEPGLEVLEEVGDGELDGHGDLGLGVLVVAPPLADLGEADRDEERQRADVERVHHHAPLEKLAM